MIQFLIGKYYEKMLRDNKEDAKMRTCVYAATLMSSLALTFTVPFSTFLRKWYFLKPDAFYNEDIEMCMYIFLILILPALYAYFRYFYRKDPEAYIAKYQSVQLNVYFTTFLLGFVPFILFFAGPLLTIFLFGGGFLKYDVPGILTPLF